MFCGGCIGGVPTASMLIALCFSVLWLGDAVLESTKTQSYWVVHRKQPLWQVGETKEDATVRRLEEQPVELEDSGRYPEDYSGRIQGVFPYKDARPSWAVGSFGCEMFQLTDVQRQTCWQRAVKVAGGALVPVTFEDKFGANAEALRERYTDAEVVAAKTGDDPKSVEILAKTLSLYKSLDKTITHTGTGLYTVKKTPVNESEVQLGAVAGQVVTIVGTVAASPAFTGGYISNTTRSQVRAIVSHTANTATMEGDITTWVDTDTLEWYDSWGTVDAACEQLYVDQGATRFSSSQEIRIYAGTYNEAISINTMEATHVYRLSFTSSGAVTLDNNALATSLINLDDTENVEIHDITLNCDNNSNIYANGRGPFWLFNVTCTGGNGGFVRDAYSYDTTFDTLTYAFRMSSGVYERCTFIDCTYGANWTMTLSTQTFRACIFTGCTDCMYVTAGQTNTFFGGTYALKVINCTVYDCTRFVDLYSSTGCNGLEMLVENTVFHTVGTPYYIAAADGTLISGVCSNNTYYNCTQIARLGGANVNFASWQALVDHYGVSPDTNSVTTDPGITTPGSDWSLTAASNCRHAGIGSYSDVTTGINEVAFDKYHPDKGAWSSGVGPNKSWGG
jgi:hypothetical protein